MNTSLFRQNLNKPVDHAKEYYGDRFDAMVLEFLKPHRYIYSGDDFFVLAYPHVLESLFEQNLNKTLDEIDVWVIHYFSGEIKRLFDIAPFDLPHVAFQRKGKWKIYDTEKLKRKLRV